MSYQQQQQGKSVHWDDEDQPQQVPTEEFDLSRLPASQRWQYRAMMAAAAVTEYGGVAIKYGWLPFVALMGMSNVYCASPALPFQHLLMQPQ